LVTHSVPESVVDALEVVEVDEHHGDRDALIQGPADLLCEQRAVRQTGQRIVVGLMV
jgi:hypothetical protein